MTPIEILLVEDDALDQLLTSRALRSGCVHALSVKVARDGAEALRFLADEGRHERRPKLVVMDLDMPRVNGFELLERLRADDSLRDIPVVVLSASPEETSRERSVALGAREFVAKPVDYAELRRAAREITARWLDAA